VPAHERILEPERKARVLECGSLLPSWFSGQPLNAQASLRIYLKPVGRTIAKSMRRRCRRGETQALPGQHVLHGFSCASANY